MATYAEMCSYYLTPLPKEQATILQKNGSVILALYALADMGIHYDGWSRIDTAAFLQIRNFRCRNDTENLRSDPWFTGQLSEILYWICQISGIEEMLGGKMGEDFSQKEFHRAVLSVGPAPFDVVETYMWNYAQ